MLFAKLNQYHFISLYDFFIFKTFYFTLLYYKPKDASSGPRDFIEDSWHISI